ncbi:MULTISPECIES: SHOCT domain-containing protein [unclassified Kitasatospora]|uniref:SHOCT domain-containing protein n=1 Tax=unclassified Kitasatospora TaxID=2633591 RepID=UPI00331A37FA
MDWTDLIDAAFDVAGNSNRDNRAEALRTVEANVVPDEKPVASTAGRHPDHFRKGVLVLTTQRLLFLKDGKPPVPVPLSAVTDATVNRSRLNGEVLLVVALTGSHRFEDVVKAEVFAEQIRATARLVREAAAKAPAAPAGAPAVAPAASGTELLDQLERLTALHTAGALTDEEFSRAKQRLIG